VTDLFWPGAERAAEIFSDTAFLDAMVHVEDAWLTVLVDRGVAPAAARASLTALVAADDVPAVAAGAERDGNPVTALVRMLRDRTDGAAARWLHRGLTSQDVLDSALMLCLRDAVTRIEADLGRQVSTLAALTDRHRDTPMLARTLTQPALPTTVGMRTARWLSGVLDAADHLAALTPVPVQVGGAAGTLAAIVELTGSPDAAVAVAADLADALGLASAAPWHTTRSFITRTGDALVGCCDAWGHIANDVATGSRAEIGEFAESSGGGSSTMPHKANPVLSVLIRSAALSAPPLGGALHAASAASIEERSDGGWHAEWATLRTLARRTVVAGSQTADLLAGLRVDADRAAANLAAFDGVLSEQRTMAELTGRPAGSGYLGVTTALLDDVLQRATHYLKGLG
jgi:3-carboxy-cis,cis-muconate cycloisomerase